MIIGIGTDLIEIERIQRIMAGSASERFILRLLTAEERHQAKLRQGRLNEFIAGRFSAKEAIAKALGCGIGGRLSFQDIEVTYTSTGKPICRISEQALKRLELNANVRIHISITHTGTLAAAYAIVEDVIEMNGID
jgi:holo-[acyl-carrier protein] synthase